MFVPGEPVLSMALRPSWVEPGPRHSLIKKINYEAGEVGMGPRHDKVWLGAHGLECLSLTISDAALRCATNGIGGDVELRCVQKSADARLGALLAAVNAERIAGFPGGRLFLDSIEQALAVALVNDYAVRRPSARIYRGGLTPARLRRVVELVHAEMESDLSLRELADAAGLSIAHFSQMFRQSTGQRPHQFVLHRRVDRAKEMLRAAKSGAGCGGGLRVQEPAALCARLPQCVRSQSHTIPAGICAPGPARRSVNKAPRFLRRPPRDRQGKRSRAFAADWPNKAIDGKRPTAARKTWRRFVSVTRLCRTNLCLRPRIIRLLHRHDHLRVIFGRLLMTAKNQWVLARIASATHRPSGNDEP